MSVFVAVLGTMALGGIGVLVVRVVRRVRRRWKELEYEGVDPSKWRDLGFLVSIASLFPSWSRQSPSDEEDDEEEIRPLLE